MTLAAQNNGSVAGGFVILIVLAVLYFVPLILAMSRKVPNVGSVAVINVLLGWTLIGWVVALAMAARSVPARPAIDGPEAPSGPSSGPPLKWGEGQYEKRHGKA